MPSNNSKYSEEMREQTAKYILESGKSATSVAEEMGIDKNTVCSWVRDYRRRNHLPTYAEEKGIVYSASNNSKDTDDLMKRVKELENKLKEKDKEIKKLNEKVIDEKEKVEILKKSLHIFMQPRE